ETNPRSYERREKAAYSSSCRGPRPPPVVPGCLVGKRLNLRQNTLRCKKVLAAFPIPNEVSRFPLDQHLGRTRPGIVIRAHRHAVSTRRHDREKVPGCDRERARPGEKIRRFADWTHNVVTLRRTVPPRHRKDLVPGVVQRWAQQVIHRRIGYHEALCSAMLEIFDAGEQKPGVADKRTAGLEQDSHLALAKALEQASQVVLHRRGRLVAITDAEPPAQIEMLQMHPGGVQDIDKLERF